MPTYGAKIQFTKNANNSAKLGPKDTKFIQKVTGTFLCYTRVEDSTMLVALNKIASKKVAPTGEMVKKIKIL